MKMNNNNLGFKNFLNGKYFKFNLYKFNICSLLRKISK